MPLKNEDIRFEKKTRAILETLATLDFTFFKPLRAKWETRKKIVSNSILREATNDKWPKAGWENRSQPPSPTREESGSRTAFLRVVLSLRERVRHGDILFLRNTSGFDLALAPDRTPFSLPEWFHFGFRLGSARAVRKLHGRMSSEGMKVHDIEEHADYVTFRCMDSDGYGIEVYWE